MISVSNKEIKKIFLTKKTKVSALSSKVDIIVSPEFYWVRKFEIPVKTETQARHLLPTLFEDIVNEKQVLTYQVIKLEDNQFLCFAYNNKKIYDAIKDSDIPISNIQAFYFAQNECKSFRTFETNNQKFMYTSEDILVKVPNNLIEDTINFDRVIDKIKPSNHKMQIKLYNDVISSKFYYSLFFIFAVLISSNLIKIVSYTSEIEDLNNKYEQIKKTNKLPQSMIRTNSILESYNSTVSKELKKREAIAYIIKNRKLNLNSLKIENENIVLGYLSANKNAVENYLKKRFKNIEIKQKSLSLEVSIVL